MLHQIITDDIKKKIIDEHDNRPSVKSTKRIKEQGEVFTPPKLVIEILEQLPKEVWEDGKTYLDPTSGSGNFLAAVLIIKKELGHKYLLSTIYGVDYMKDNVIECKQRLISIVGDSEENRAIVDHNIRHENGITYDYTFKTQEEELAFFAEKLIKGQKVKKQKSTKEKQELPMSMFDQPNL